MRRPSPVCEYPTENMYAEKTSQTVPFANPLRAQAVESAGVSRTMRNAPPTTRPTRPTAAAGIGSAMIPAMTVAKSAKYRHAPGESPSGTGSSAMIAPTTSGITTRVADEPPSRWLRHRRHDHGRRRAHTRLHCARADSWKFLPERVDDHRRGEGGDVERVQRFGAEIVAGDDRRRRDLLGQQRAEAADRREVDRRGGGRRRPSPRRAARPCR